MTSTIHHHQNKNAAQIRLLISPRMLQELNTLAASRRIPRLHLIRLYLQIMIEKELTAIDDHLDRQDKLQATRLKLDKYLNELNE